MASHPRARTSPFAVTLGDESSIRLADRPSDPGQRAAFRSPFKRAGIYGDAARNGCEEDEASGIRKTAEAREQLTAGGRGTRISRYAYKKARRAHGECSVRRDPLRAARAGNISGEASTCPT